MRTFKFLSGPSHTEHITCLHRYHKRLLGRYCDVFNLNPGQPNYNAGGLICNTVIDFINREQLTTYSEIRRYYAIAYHHLSHVDDIIDDFNHTAFIYAANAYESINNM